MAKRVVTIGFQISHDSVDREAIYSSASLLDWDLILFEPNIEPFIIHQNDTYNGRLCLDDDTSFRLKESLEHWRREIRHAFDHGRTVVIFLNTLSRIYVATGRKEYSGTGRNQRATRIVEPFDNYYAIPVKLGHTESSGTGMRLAPRMQNILSPFWSELSDHMRYRVTLEVDESRAAITTKNGEKIVGAVFRHKTSSGTIFLCPSIDFQNEKYFRVKEGKRFFTEKAHEFGRQLVSSVLSLEIALKASSQTTPEPDWAKDPRFRSSKEDQLLSELIETEREVEIAQKRKEEKIDQINSASQLRCLLFGNGAQFERAIIDALATIGFSATNYRDADSEFDVIFESTEGRLLGEAEGKDSKAVNVDKLRQLSMNIHEDLKREDVEKPAKGVLFGNGYRLVAPPGTVH